MITPRFDGGTLLITGGTGSFGRAVVDRFLDSGLDAVRILSRDEAKQETLRHEHRHPRLQFRIGDVRDPAAVREAMQGVRFVFHAAALKQVPSCEFHPLEAIATNVHGTANVLQAALDQGVERAILLSTDKAVHPINAMGMTKALAEKVMIAKARLSPPGGCVLTATRYGNVLASRGSVVPLFLSQIAAGRPMTVTDPHMTRFLMRLDESVDLVLHAFRHAEPGDIFVQHAPAATIGDVAAALSRMFGDHPVVTIGTRHGEKLHETLVSREEMARADDLGRYLRVPADARDLDYGRFISEGEPAIGDAADYTSEMTERLDAPAIEALLTSLPEVRDALARRS